MYYIKRVFFITTLHMDGDFVSLQPLVNEIPGGPQVNLVSANEHVSEIKI